MQKYFWQDPEGRREPQKQIWRVGRAVTSESLHFRKASGFKGSRRSSRGKSGLLAIQLKNGSRNMEIHMLLMLAKLWLGVHKSLSCSMGENDLLRSRFRACSLVRILTRTLSSPLRLHPSLPLIQILFSYSDPSHPRLYILHAKAIIMILFKSKNKNTIWWVDSESKLQSKWQTRKILS